jgi:hypothetical protein
MHMFHFPLSLQNVLTENFIHLILIFHIYQVQLLSQHKYYYDTMLFYYKNLFYFLSCVMKLFYIYQFLLIDYLNNLIRIIFLFIKIVLIIISIFLFLKSYLQYLYLFYFNFIYNIIFIEEVH